MAIISLGQYWRRLGASPMDAPAHADGRHAIPTWTQIRLDQCGVSSTRSTPDYAGRHRAEDREAQSLVAYIRAWGDAGSDQMCARCLTTILEDDRCAIVGPLPGVICTLCAQLISEGVTWIQGGGRHG